MIILTKQAFNKTIKITKNGKEYTLNFWDISGENKFREISRLFYKDSNIVIFIYDITNK